MFNRGIRLSRFRTLAPLLKGVNASIREINQGAQFNQQKQKQKQIQTQIPGIKTSSAIFPLYPSLRTYLPEMPKLFVYQLPKYNPFDLPIYLKNIISQSILYFNSPRKLPQTATIEDKPIKKVLQQAGAVTVRSPKTTKGELVSTPKWSSLAFAIASANQPIRAIRGLLSAQKTRNLVIPQTLVLYTGLPIVPQLNMSHGKTLSVWNLDFNPQEPMDSAIKKTITNDPEVSDLTVVAKPAISSETQLAVTQSHQKILNPQQRLEYKLEVLFQTLGATLLKNPELILREPELIGLTKPLFIPKISSLAFAIASINQQNQVIIGILPVLNTQNSIFPQTLLFLSNSPIDFQLMHIPDGNMFIQLDENFNLIETSPKNTIKTDRRFELLEDDSPELVRAEPTKFDLPTTEPVTSIPQTQRYLPIQLLEQKLKIISNAITQNGYKPEYERMIKYLIADLESRERDFSSSEFDSKKYIQILQEARELIEKQTARHEEARQASIDGADEVVATHDEVVTSDAASNTDTEDEEEDMVTVTLDDENNITEFKDSILTAMEAAINSNTKNYVGKQSKIQALDAIKKEFNSAEDEETQKTQLEKFIEKAMEHRTPSIFSRNESTAAQSTTASMLAFKKALGRDFDKVITLLSPPAAASDEEDRTELNI